MSLEKTSTATTNWRHVELLIFGGSFKGNSLREGRVGDMWIYALVWFLWVIFRCNGIVGHG